MTIDRTPMRKPVSSTFFSHSPMWVQRSIRRMVRSARRITGTEKGLVPETALERKFTEAFTYLGAAAHPSPIGDYLEFGVCTGTSMACAYRALRRVRARHIRLFGFDSFEGLPAEAAFDDGGFWQPGQFRVDEAAAREYLSSEGVDWNRVTLVKGWYEETLNEMLLSKHAITKASVIMVDCDLYSSAKTVLSFCAPLIRDRAVLFFDDWSAGDLASRNLGEKRAFDEFLAEHPELSAEDFGDYGLYSKVVIVSSRR